MADKSYLFMDRRIGPRLGAIRQLVRTPGHVQFRSVYPAQMQGPLAEIGREAAGYGLHVLEVASAGSRKEAAAVGNQAYQMLYGEGEPMVGGIVKLDRYAEEIGTFYPKTRA